MFGTNQDSQRELQTSEIRYRRLFETARDGILILDAVSRKITDVNPFMVELLGYTRDEFLGKELWEIGLLTDAEASNKAFGQLLETGYIRYEDLPLQTKQGQRREVEFVSNVYAENSQQVIQCNIRDITARKLAEKAFRESGERFRFVCESMPQKIFTAKFNGEVDYVNQQWIEFTGLCLEQGKDWHWTRFIHPADLDKTVQYWQHSLSTGEPFQIEHRLLRSDGVYRWHLCRAHPMRDADNNVVMWISSNTDIDDQKRAEQDLQQLLVLEQVARSDAERANQTKDEFLAIVSHELRTPLTTILGWSTLLRNGTLNESQATRALDAIERSAKAQSQLIEDILDVSRIVSGKLRLNLKPIELASIIKAAIDSMSLSADTKGIQIESHLDPETGLISGDRERLGQVVINLLSNAIKFTPEEGRIKVRLERENSDARIEISDNGRGIKSDLLPFIFDRFRQSDSSSTRGYSGIGVGLTIVRSIVEMHGGNVFAQSLGEGKGASFTVILPQIPRSSARVTETNLHSSLLEKEPRFKNSGELAGMRIEIVDDDPDTLEVIKAILEHGGAEVRTCDSATFGLVILAAWQPHLLISDVAMRYRDGYWFIERVRALEQPYGRRIPAIALTAYVRIEDRARLLKAGFDRYVPKPVEPAELLSIVASLAQSSIKT